MKLFSGRRRRGRGARFSEWGEVGGERSTEARVREGEEGRNDVRFSFAGGSTEARLSVAGECTTEARDMVEAGDAGGLGAARGLSKSASESSSVAMSVMRASVSSSSEPRSRSSVARSGWGLGLGFARENDAACPRTSSSSDSESSLILIKLPSSLRRGGLLSAARPSRRASAPLRLRRFVEEVRVVCVSSDWRVDIDARGWCLYCLGGRGSTATGAGVREMRTGDVIVVGETGKPEGGEERPVVVKW